jgi:phosphoglycerol transferase MdoB-like AlkP superfamily enzyme
MESYDSWPLMDDYKDLNISSSLKNIEDHGIRFNNFLPAANTTMNSLGAIITGIPYCGVNISKIGALRSFPSSIFTQFKKLGYKTNFFCTVYTSWQNIGDFVEKQGVDNIYDGATSNAPKGIWGINDENLFKNVLKNVDSTKNSLNIILTMSYHTPYEEDIYREGFKYKSIEDLPKKYREKYHEEEIPFPVLGHFWYADRAIGRFVEKAENKYPNSLFAFTGDHYSRRFIYGSPTLYESSSVPFILYGKSINHLAQKKETPGSHIDIAPTLLGLLTPKKYSYYSFGNSVLDTINQENKLGVGYNKTISKSYLQEFTKNYGTKKQFFNAQFEDRLEKEKDKIKYDSLMSLAWYYTIKGDTIR